MIGKLFLVVGPSGVGKGTLVRALRERHSEFFFPPSATTRSIRAGEEEGRQYHFLSDEQFAKLEQDGEFLETAIVHGTEKYGILRKPILGAITDEKVVIREVDIQGLKSIHQNLEKDLFEAIFIVPPDFEILKKRIHKRQPNISDEELSRRIDSAKKEIAQKNLADFEVVSGENEIPKMVAEVEEFISAKIKS
ncbi:guanylate kinase [Candidatus Gracilibacteria bacterium]|nr:guanylate kinase [Candidatus Gracilibacteria bacterium]MCF7856641.1 guanylate kinase [Candidatus Gracilibacteria bacterium]MCF7896958.1 guanylate kinase [Candidatus Gracilibacteria bacterium]